MWIANSGQKLKKAFDSAIQNAYGNGVNGELENLSNLFTPFAIDSYQAALHAGLDTESTASIDVAWIDKRPIAKLKAKEAGAELGDMMLVVNEYRPGTPPQKTSRACLLEVKQSPAMEIPPVPVTTGASTWNQFKILSNWPLIFGLKATGKNNSYLLHNVDTTVKDKSFDTRAQAWYVAVKPPTPAGITSTPWMAAPAILSAKFEHTLGDLFAACSRGRKLKNTAASAEIPVGRDFSHMSILDTPPGWDALILSIISVTQSYEMPPKLFTGKPGKRYIQGKPYRYLPAFAGMNSIPSPNSSISAIALSLTALIGMSYFTYQLLKSRKKRFVVLTLNIFHSSVEQDSDD